MFASVGSLQQAMANGARLLSSDPASAAEQAKEVIAHRPEIVDAHRLLGEALRRLGRFEDADHAECAAVDAGLAQSELKQAVDLIAAGRVRDAEIITRNVLQRRPFDGAASLLLAQIAIRSGMAKAAEDLVRKTLSLAPGHRGARQTLASILAQLYRMDESLAILSDLHNDSSDDREVIGQFTALLSQLGRYDRVVQLFDAALELFPDDVSLLLGCGHVMKTIGRKRECVSAYRKIVRLQPGNGEAWWSLANIKTEPFSNDDVEFINRALNSSSVGSENRVGLHFALGKAFDDRADYHQAIEQFDKGNAIKLEQQPYDPAAITDEVDRSIRFLSGNIGHNAKCGQRLDTPIFIVGMPRAGSTLIEQILSSHSAIEGTSELPIIPTIIQHELATQSFDQRAHYPELFNQHLDEDFARIGQTYLAASRYHRHTAASIFTDKLPNNWLNIGLILRALPTAKIIDARRNPLDCCLSNYQQLFARGQNYSYSLDHLGRYYRDYVRLMDHVDTIAPGRILRVIHEDLVQAPEFEIQRMLAFLGLEFETSCLEFHKSNRPVRTASAEQVRRPLTSSGIGKWRPYDQWLNPLRHALGDALFAYR